MLRSIVNMHEKLTFSGFDQIFPGMVFALLHIQCFQNTKLLTVAAFYRKLMFLICKK